MMTQMIRVALIVATTALLATAQTCHIHGALPDARCTPGAIRTTDARAICAPTFRTGPYRHTTASTKRRVFAEYGITHHRPGQYEVDHLIPLELGGADVIANLWPEAALPIPGFHQKDKLENYLCREVCAGRITLPVAQRCLSDNWLTCAHQLPDSVTLTP